VKLVVKAFLVLVLILSIGSSEASAHNYYVSICTIDFNKANQSLELTFKLTAHDLEKTFSEYQKLELRLGSAQEHKEANQLITEYINTHFTLSISGEKKELNFIGKEVELDESLYLYFEIKDVGSVEKMKVMNNILVEKFEAQENILHLNVGSKHLSVVFNRSITSKEIRIE